MNGKIAVNFPEGPLVFAVSGGVDSMVMLDLARKKIEKNRIIVAHFNHHLRGQNAINDANFVKNFCQKNAITFFGGEKNVAKIAHEKKMSIEAAARLARYDFLCEVHQKTLATAIITAHHLDDRIETAIFNMIRGAKFSGICALKTSQKMFFPSQNSAILMARPMIYLTKKEIMDYAKKYQISFREDETNADISLQRNFLRKEILPKFSIINPNYQKSLKNFIDYAENILRAQRVNAKKWLFDQEKMLSSPQKKYISRYQKIPKHLFSSEDFAFLDEIERSAIVEYLYFSLNNGNIGLSEGLIAEFFRFILEGKNSFGVKKIGNILAERRGKIIYIFPLFS